MPSGEVTSPPGEGVFLYGFEPFREFGRNASEAAVRALPSMAGLRTAVFPVRFSRNMLLAPIRAEPPAIVIGLGQCRHGRKLRLERKAVNLHAEPGADERPIAPRGPDHRFATLSLQRTAETRVSYDAGTYVCNFSMYVMLEQCHRSGARFGFIHIPRSYPVVAACDYLVSLLHGLGAGRFSP